MNKFEKLTAWLDSLDLARLVPRLHTFLHFLLSSVLLCPFSSLMPFGFAVEALIPDQAHSNFEQELVDQLRRSLLEQELRHVELHWSFMIVFEP